MNKLYARRVKLSDRYLDFDPFDHPFGGRTKMFYPKVTVKMFLKFRYGIYEQNDEHKNTCYSFGKSKRELQKWCDIRNVERLEEERRELNRKAGLI